MLLIAFAILAGVGSARSQGMCCRIEVVLSRNMTDIPLNFELDDFLSLLLRFRSNRNVVMPHLDKAFWRAWIIFHRGSSVMIVLLFNGRRMFIPILTIISNVVVLFSQKV